MVLEGFLNKPAAGAELYSLRRLDKKGFYREKFAALFPEINRRRMILDETEFQKVIARAEWFIRRFSADMRALNIEVKPRDCASHCPYSPVCRIEKWKLPMMVQELREEDRKLWKEQRGMQEVSR